MINTYVWKMLTSVCVFAALLWWWIEQEMQWGMDLVPGPWGELDRKLILDEVKNPPFRPQHSFDLFVYLQHLFAANWVCFQGKLWRASFKMPQQTQTCLWQRSNGFCLRHFCVILVFQYQLSWLLPAWSRKEREINQQSHYRRRTGTSLSVPFLRACRGTPWNDEAAHI